VESEGRIHISSERVSPGDPIFLDLTKSLAYKIIIVDDFRGPLSCYWSTFTAEMAEKAEKSVFVAVTAANPRDL
jgi:hypothetical protein